MLSVVRFVNHTVLSSVNMVTDWITTCIIGFKQRRALRHWVLLRESALSPVEVLG